MTETVHPVAASDELISALAERRRIDVGDPVLRALEAWVRRIDSQPMAPWTRPLPPVAKVTSSAELARRVAALTLALTVSSSGLATAVCGDPLSPLHFVKRQFTHLRHDQPHRAPWSPGDRVGFDPRRPAVPETSRSLQRPDQPASHRLDSRNVRRHPSP
jgi:hypothetical protein